MPAVGQQGSEPGLVSRLGGLHEIALTLKNPRGLIEPQAQAVTRCAGKVEIASVGADITPPIRGRYSITYRDILRREGVERHQIYDLAICGEPVLERKLLRKHLEPLDGLRREIRDLLEIRDAASVQQDDRLLRRGCLDAAHLAPQAGNEPIDVPRSISADVQGIENARGRDMAQDRPPRSDGGDDDVRIVDVRPDGADGCPVQYGAQIWIGLESLQHLLQELGRQWLAIGSCDGDVWRKPQIRRLPGIVRGRLSPGRNFVGRGGRHRLLRVQRGRA